MKKAGLRKCPTLTACVAMGALLLCALPRIAAAQDTASDEDFVLNGNAENGKAVYARICLPCHGEKGDGNGPAGAALNPKPANYTDYARMSTLSDKYLYTIVSEGGPAVGKSVLMASWKAVLSDQEIRDVVAFIKTFAKKPE